MRGITIETRDKKMRKREVVDEAPQIGKEHLSVYKL
jgi:hypothetical protein